MKHFVCKLSQIILVVSLFITFLIQVPSFADVGGIQRYQSSDSSSYSSSSSSSSGGFSIGSLLVILVVVGVLIYSKKHGLNNTKSVAEQIREIDPAFSEDNFLSWSREVFIKLQNAWTKKDWTIIRPFESNELFELHNSQLQEFINSGRTNIIERINVLSSSLYSFSQDGDKETLKINLRAIMRDYIINDSTQKVLEGNPNIDQIMNYRLTFIRKAGVKTKEGTSQKSTTNCPNCGAPTKITSAGQCEYCGSIITTGEHDWVLSNLEGI